MSGFVASDGAARRGAEPTPPGPEPSPGHPIPARSDLLVVLNELNRIREAEVWSTQSAGEVLTLAATAVRIVESQLATVGDDGLGKDDAAVARDVLHAALDVLRAALSRMDGETPGEPGRRSWLRRSRRKVTSSS